MNLGNHTLSDREKYDNVTFERGLNHVVNSKGSIREEAQLYYLKNGTYVPLGTLGSLKKNSSYGDAEIRSGSGEIIDNTKVYTMERVKMGGKSKRTKRTKRTKRKSKKGKKRS